MRTLLPPLTGAMLLGIVPALVGAEPTPGKGPLPAAKAGVVQDTGTLVIVGGGPLPDTIRDRFLALAGSKKARLVVIPTASAWADQHKVYNSFLYWRAQGAGSVVMLHTLDRKKANDPAFVKPLQEATGVWLGGGDQVRLTAIYHGTLVEKELRRVLARGGVVGGTSAGASAMSAVMITGGNPVAQVGDGFGLLPDVVIDQHFQNRKRLARLLGVLKRHPRCLGLGIDEQTAVIVHENVATVVGNANVRFCPPGGEEPKVQVFKAGQRLDLLALSRAALPRPGPSVAEARILTPKAKTPPVEARATGTPRTSTSSH